MFQVVCKETIRHREFSFWCRKLNGIKRYCYLILFYFRISLFILLSIFVFFLGGALHSSINSHSFNRTLFSEHVCCHKIQISWTILWIWRIQSSLYRFLYQVCMRKRTKLLILNMVEFLNFGITMCNTWTVW